MIFCGIKLKIRFFSLYFKLNISTIICYRTCNIIKLNIYLDNISVNFVDLNYILKLNLKLAKRHDLFALCFLKKIKNRFLFSLKFHFKLFVHICDVKREINLILFKEIS